MRKGRKLKENLKKARGKQRIIQNISKKNLIFVLPFYCYLLLLYVLCDFSIIIFHLYVQYRETSSVSFFISL